jgi:hypothetical protein
MIEAATPRVPANPAGSDVTLSEEDIWQALVWKAEFAHLFVKPIKACRVIERFDDGFLREIEHEDSQGHDVLHERIFLDPRKSVTFLRLNGPVYGQIVNTISHEGPLSLDFSFTLGLPGESHGSEKEKAYEEEFLAGYLLAANATLEAARDYVRTGIDPTLDPAAAK